MRGTETNGRPIWENTTVLVTGGAGFIGSNLVRRLVEYGSEVVVADNFSRGNLENIEPLLDRITLRRMDLTDIGNCISVSRHIDYVFHLASSVGGIQYISTAPVENLTPSCVMNLNMLEAVRKNEARGFLFTSSACIYGSKSDEVNIFREEEAYPANPPTTYGWAKILGEIACKAYHEDYGIRSSVIRIFNAYGENENFDPKSSHVIPSLIRQAIMYPHGDFVIFGDGNQERAFLYVQDLVDALLLAMQKDSGADPINVGAERLVSINELAQKIVRISGKRVHVKHDPKGPRGVNRYRADVAKARTVLGWSPQTSLETGLKQTYDWGVRRLSLVAT